MSSKDAPAKCASGSRKPKGSREAALLQQQSFVKYDKSRGSGHAQSVACKSGAAAADQEPEGSPPRDRRKNIALGQPVSGHGERKQVDGPEGRPADPVLVNGKAAKKKRTASAPAADSTAVEDIREKKIKCADERPRQVLPNGRGNGGEANASGSIRHTAKAPDPDTFRSALGTGRDMEMNTQLQDSNDDSKAQGASAGGRGTEQHAVGGSAEAGITRAAEPDAAEQPAANSGPSRKYCKGAGQSAGVAPSGAVPSTTAAEMRQDSGQPRGASQAAYKVHKQHAAASPLGNAAAPGGPAGQPSAAAAVEPHPEPPPEPQEGVAAAEASGHGRKLNWARAPTAQQRAAEAAGISIVDGKQYPPTGTTPVKPFVPVPLARLDVLGPMERMAIIELQRQLAETRGLYEELKATKIQDLERVLVQQEELTAEQVRQAEHRAILWKAAAERAEERARAVGSQEVKDHIRNLEVRIEELLQQNSNQLIQIASLQRELAIAQQAFDDAQAKLADKEAAQDTRVRERDMDIEGDGAEQCCQDDAGALTGTPPAQDVDGAQQLVTGEAVPEEPSPVVTLGGGLSAGQHAAAKPVWSRGGGGSGGRQSLTCGVGVQFPTPPPSGGFRFASPSVNLICCKDTSADAPDPSQCSAQRGVGTQCQMVINMLPHIRTPSPSIPSHLGPADGPPTSHDSATLNGGPGISTECLRVVKNLPHLRASSPSVPSRLASITVPLATQAKGAEPPASGATPVATHGAGRPNVQPESGKRRSNGSPIDGICQLGSGNKEAEPPHDQALGAPGQQDQYSFVDLNPASARKGAQTGAAVALAVAATEGPCNGDRVHIASEGLPDMAALVAAAASTTLPPSPRPSLQGGMPTASFSVNGCVLPNARRPVGQNVASPREKNTAGQGGQVHFASKIGHLGPPPLAAAAALYSEGGSAQDSCTLSAVALRGVAQQMEVECIRNQVHTAALAGKLTAASPVQVAMAKGADRAGLPGTDAGGVPCDAQEPRVACRSPSPSPRTAAVKFWEEVSGWKMELGNGKPGYEFLMTHKATGMRFSLRETEMDDEEVAVHINGPGQLPKRFVEYTPLELGTVEEHVTEWVKDTLVITEDKRGELLDALEKAVKAAASKLKAP